MKIELEPEDRGPNAFGEAKCVWCNRWTQEYQYLGKTHHYPICIDIGLCLVEFVRIAEIVRKVDSE